ncbi:YceI family protein [Winogradskyella wandonensis]|nr:YceI family protein [Winogradskyella wandonensis]
MFNYTFDEGFSKTKSYRIYFSPESSLIIKGTSNVNSFKCEYNISKFSDSLSVNFLENLDIIEFKNTELILPNINFNCGHRGITKDFNKLLKTEEFPQIRIALLRVISLDNSENEAIVSLDITICGISNTYDIPIKVNGNNEVRVQGLLPINIEDFKLEAPTKVLGIIKVSNKIEIDFNLKILKC